VKRTGLGLLLAGLVLVAYVVPDAGALGVGVVLGEPTGLSMKQWVSVRAALGGAAAWSFEDQSAFHVHVDYLLHGPVQVEGDAGRLLYYFGLGGRLKAEEEESRFGVRAPLGIDYVFAVSPLDIFLEVVPLLDLAPGTDFHINGGIGIRYFF
jgi:hypothetical protein